MAPGQGGRTTRHAEIAFCSMETRGRQAGQEGTALWKGFRLPYKRRNCLLMSGSCLKLPLHPAFSQADPIIPVCENNYKAQGGKKHPTADFLFMQFILSLFTFDVACLIASIKHLYYLNKVYYAQLYLDI